MTENLPIIKTDQHLIREMIDRAIQEADPADNKYPNYRRYNLTRLIPEKNLSDALEEVSSLMRGIKSLRFTVERKTGENTVEYVVEKIDKALPGGSEEAVPVADFMQMRFLRDIGMILNRLPQESI